MSQTVVVNQNRSPQRDKPRREPMRRVRVTFREDLGPMAQTVVAGQCLRKMQADAEGSVPLTAYESDVPRIQALVEEDAAAVELARAAYTRKLHAEIRERLRSDRGRDFEIPEDMSQWDDAMRAVEATFGGSVEAEFFNLTGRGIKPLAGVEVDAEELPPPMSEHEESVAAVAQRFAGGGVNAGDLAQALVNALQVAGVIPSDSGGKRSK